MIFFSSFVDEIEQQSTNKTHLYAQIHTHTGCFDAAKTAPNACECASRRYIVIYVQHSSCTIGHADGHDDDDGVVGGHT